MEEEREIGVPDCFPANMSGRQCETASETQEWIQAIIEFLKPYIFLIDGHVVNFFKDRLWEAIDEDWTDSLRNEPVENLLRIPSGVAQDHWPASLKEFVFNVKSLSFRREQANLEEEFPGLQISSLNGVLAQGMNRKKKHEIEALSAIVDSVARNVASETIIDVGSGQGYLAQVLSFEHGLSVFAIDASSHHGNITGARAERIKKYYAAKLRKTQSENRELILPKTITLNVRSANALSEYLLEGDFKKLSMVKESINEKGQEEPGENALSFSYARFNSSLVLAGLHACGDLSTTMLRTFLDCDKVKGVISIGCCYNLLSEGSTEKASTDCGFPMSNGVKSTGFLLGRSSRDLACQSAERWRGLGESAGSHNLWLHAFRAAFQMVLYRYYPDMLCKSPAIGRQGKALRRRQHTKILESGLHHIIPEDSSACLSCNSNASGKSWNRALPERQISEAKGAPLYNCLAALLYVQITAYSVCEPSHGSSVAVSSEDTYSLFLKYCESGLGRLGIHASQDIDIHGVWAETKPFTGLIGPYWSIRAALGPLLETLILLDRLLFLQEQVGNKVEVVMLPIFDPVISPRNIAIIAKKL